MVHPTPKLRACLKEGWGRNGGEKALLDQTRVPPCPASHIKVALRKSCKAGIKATVPPACCPPQPPENNNQKLPRGGYTSSLLVIWTSPSKTSMNVMPLWNIWKHGRSQSVLGGISSQTWQSGGFIFEVTQGIFLFSILPDACTVTALQAAVTGKQSHSHHRGEAQTPSWLQRGLRQGRTSLACF